MCSISELFEGLCLNLGLCDISLGKNIQIIWDIEAIPSRCVFDLIGGGAFSVVFWVFGAIPLGPVRFGTYTWVTRERVPLVFPPSNSSPRMKKWRHFQNVYLKWNKCRPSGQIKHQQVYRRHFWGLSNSNFPLEFLWRLWDRPQKPSLSVSFTAFRTQHARCLAGRCDPLGLPSRWRKKTRNPNRWFHAMSIVQIHRAGNRDSVGVRCCPCFHREGNQ